MQYPIRVCGAWINSFAIAVIVSALALCVVQTAVGQTNAATLNGVVTDSSGAVIPKASLKLENIATGTVRSGETNGSGQFVMPSLDPGIYALRVEKEGFAISEVKDITLRTADNVALEVKLKVGSGTETVTVNAGSSLTTDSPAVSMTVDREFVENMPLNGRSFQDLIQLAPGAVSSQTGYYSINGQRTDSNNYTVDGVSANLGGYNNLSTGSYGSGLSGSTPSQTVLGTTQSLASIDSLQEFTIQTSGYTAEYGRNPGGQVQLTTRSGTNDFHGSLFEYLRNTAFDANSWQNNYNGVAQTAEHQNDFGGTVGGPVIFPRLYDGKNKTFFFFSYEGLRLLLPASESEYVPTEAFRNWASTGLQPFLNAKPLPSPNSPGNKDGCTVNNQPFDGTQNTACDALFNYGYSYPNNLDNIGIRVDHMLGKRLHLFARYADTPSSQVLGAENTTTETINTHTWTGGLTLNLTNSLLDDFRFNYSHDGEENVRGLKAIGGGVPWDSSLLIPAAYDGPFAYAYSRIAVSGTSLSASSFIGGSGTAQHQYQLVDGLTLTRASRNLKFGMDWRRLTPTWSSYPYESAPQSIGLPAIQQGYATSLIVSVAAPGKPIIDSLSLYAQDHWKISHKLSIDYGLRWEFDPPPGPSNGAYPLALTSSNLITAQIAPQGTAPFRTNYHSFAPRFGFAWDATQSQTHPLTVRGGFGIFFDTAQAAATLAYAGSYPFMASRPTQTNIPFPLSSGALLPPSLPSPLTQPYPNMSVSDPNLTLPYTEQWNLSFDELINHNNKLTVSYLGNNGRKLPYTQYYGSIPGNSAFTSLYFANNGSQSNYNALQVQDTGRIVTGLDMVASFTWAHALDNASNDSSQYAPIYGNSSYDVRRVLNLALNYQAPATDFGKNWMHKIIHGWLVANRFSTQSGYPLKVTQSTLYLPDGSQVQYTPDLVPGVPIYLHGQAADVNGKPVPGSWRLNRAAFACTTTGATSGACPGTPTRNGTLGRNYLRNPSFWSLNTAVQRSFPIYERLHLNFRAEAFNVFNHPNFETLSTILSSSTFGQTIGGTSTIGSDNTLYAMGAARSLQLSLHLSF